MLFQTASGARRAWQVVTMSADRPALTVVDAADGARALPRRARLRPGGDDPTPYSADVWSSYPGHRALAAVAQTVSLTGSGWLPAGRWFCCRATTFIRTWTSTATASSGTTEEVKPTGVSGYRFTLHPTQAPGEPCSTNVCTWLPNTAFSWQANGNASRTATQNFYFINKWHDYLQAAPIGFTEAAGNFQKVNTSGQGKGNDAVTGRVVVRCRRRQRPAHRDFIDNADFDTPPDGQAPTMRMFLFHEPFTEAGAGRRLPAGGRVGQRGHRLPRVHPRPVPPARRRRRATTRRSTRSRARRWARPGATGTGWTTWSTTAPRPARPTAPARTWSRVGYVLGAARHGHPVDADRLPGRVRDPACAGILGTGGGGYTYADVKTIWNRTRGDVHAAGEVWAQTLWDLRGSLIGRSARWRDAAGRVPGHPRRWSCRRRTRRCSTCATRILAADIADYGSADVDAIWAVFAARGMGFFASSQSGDDTAPGGELRAAARARRPDRHAERHRRQLGRRRAARAG